MMLRSASMIFTILCGTSALGMTKGELYQATVAFAEKSCPEAFAAHQRHWPPADASTNVAWQSPTLLTDKASSRFDAPPPDVVKKVLAFNVSRYALIEDFVRIHSYAKRPAQEPGEYFYLKLERAESLMASVDLYTCLRPSGEELVSMATIVNTSGARKLVEQEFSYTDCIAEMSAEMAETFLVLEAEDVHAALQPFVNADEECRSGSK